MNDKSNLLAVKKWTKEDTIEAIEEEFLLMRYQDSEGNWKNFSKKITEMGAICEGSSSLI